MLMPSPRHTAADLELWREYEAADLAYPADRLDRLEAEAVDVIRAFAREPCYVSVSGGKDSSVLWALASLAGVPIPVRHLDTRPLADPHVADVLAELHRRYPLPFAVVENWCRYDARGWHATGTFEAGIAEINRQLGTDRYICGVRADESGVRKISARHLGKTTERSCRPLLWWSAADVYAYAAIRRVPLHPNYAMLGGGRWTRDKIRVAFLGLTHGDNYGRAEWEREYYGDVIRRLESTQFGNGSPKHRRPGLTRGVVGRGRQDGRNLIE